MANDPPSFSPVLIPPPAVPGVNFGRLPRDTLPGAGAGTFRNSLGREITTLVGAMTRLVEERIEQVTRATPVPPPVVVPPLGQLAAGDIYQLSQSEQRERAFRMGR
jgi:hypothetical protein